MLHLTGEAAYLKNPFVSVSTRVHPWLNCVFGMIRATGPRLKTCLPSASGVVVRQMKSVLAALASLLLVGCASMRSRVTLTPLDSGHEITVSVGQVLVVELPSNRTTGYSWAVAGTPAPILVTLGEPAYNQDLSPLGIVGAGGTEIWRFRAAKPGRETLRLKYAHSWEKNVAPVNVVTFNVVVNER